MDEVRAAIDRIYRAESRRVFATLVRLVGDFDLAEEALHEAFAAAVASWPRDGVPASPRAWLVSAGRFKATDAARRQARFADLAPKLARNSAAESADADDTAVPDDRLRLVFTCCHPAIAPEAQVALTLREVCGLTTAEVAAALLASPAALAQRLVRAKAKIRTAGIPYVVPGAADLSNRMQSVLAVVYLVFNEGYSASAGDAVTRPDLTAEAVRLGRLLLELLPEPEVAGLLALMLLHESRRPARTDAAGDLVLLEDQDRSLWARRLIEEGRSLVGRALAAGPVGPYAVQAAVAAVHADAASAADTDWPQIVALYDLLIRLNPSAVAELNRAAAVAMRDGPAAGLALIDAILGRGDLAEYHLAHAARADLCRRLGRADDARDAYSRALALAGQEPERRFLRKRLAELGRAAA